jgi:hypothetical protein
MGVYDNKYCVILNDFLASYPNDWPITYSADTETEAESKGSFNTMPDLVSRSVYKPQLRNHTAMIYEPTGKSFKGGIYLMLPAD